MESCIRKTDRWWLHTSSKASQKVPQSSFFPMDHTTKAFLSIIKLKTKKVDLSMKASYMKVVFTKMPSMATAKNQAMVTHFRVSMWMEGRWRAFLAGNKENRFTSTMDPSTKTSNSKATANSNRAQSEFTKEISSTAWSMAPVSTPTSRTTSDTRANTRTERRAETEQSTTMTILSHIQGISKTTCPTGKATLLRTGKRVTPNSRTVWTSKDCPHDC